VGNSDWKYWFRKRLVGDLVGRSAAHLPKRDVLDRGFGRLSTIKSRDIYHGLITNSRLLEVSTPIMRPASDYIIPSSHKNLASS
jgi:hypothetical protein